MSTVQGFKYICDIFSIITSDPLKKETYKNYAKSGETFKPKDKDSLVEDWSKFSKNVINSHPEEKEELLKYYSYLSDDREVIEKNGKMDKYEEIVDKHYYSNKGKTTLDNSFTNILVNGNGSTPYLFYGIAMSIALAADSFYQSSVFYIGIEEIKEILFKTLELFEYENIYCIPDDSFINDDKNVKRLLLFSLFLFLKVVFPHKQCEMENNFNTGKKLLEKVINSDENSPLFSAIKSASESCRIIESLFEAQDEDCRHSDMFEWPEQDLEKFYIVPTVKGMDRFGLLSCDNHSKIRVYVEGKEGCGKSCLAKAISLVCRNKLINATLSENLKKEFGLEDSCYVPIILDCQDLVLTDINRCSLIEHALDKMYRVAWSSLSKDNCAITPLKHYNKCKKYVITYIERKALGGELLLIVDGLSKLQGSLMMDFTQKLKALCDDQYPHLNIVILTDRIKQSEMRYFNMYNKFEILNNQYEIDLFKITKDYFKDQSITLDTLLENRLIAAFIDTPRRFCKLVKRPSIKNFFSLISEDIDYEIEQKCEETDYQTCKTFLIQLACEALKRRNDINSYPIIPANMIDRRISIQTKINGEVNDDSWKVVQKNHILIERSKRINSYEFNSILYFESLVVDYLMDFLECDECVMSSGIMMNYLSKLSGSEFSRVLLNIFYRVSNFNSNKKITVNEENLDMFMKVIVGISLSFESIKDRESCMWALNNILSNQDLVDAFVKSGKYENRTRLLRLIDNLIFSLKSIENHCV